jgi:hypothetical protein
VTVVVDLSRFASLRKNECLEIECDCGSSPQGLRRRNSQWTSGSSKQADAIRDEHKEEVLL